MYRGRHLSIHWVGGVSAMSMGFEQDPFLVGATDSTVNAAAAELTCSEPGAGLPPHKSGDHHRDARD